MSVSTCPLNKTCKHAHLKIQVGHYSIVHHQKGGKKWTIKEEERDRWEQSGSESSRVVEK